MLSSCRILPLFYDENKQFMKRSWLKRKSPLKQKSENPTAECKERIQALLRAIAIIRDGGCVLRFYSQAGACGGYRNDGTLILQAEHLNTRERNISYGDMRNIVCLCQRHHGYFKPQHGALYWSLIRRHIGEQRWAWLERIIADNRTYHMGLHEWVLVEIALRAELARLGSQEEPNMLA